MLQSSSNGGEVSYKFNAHVIIRVQELVIKLMFFRFIKDRLLWF